MQQDIKTIIYAGFFTRLLSTFVDISIVVVLLAVVSVALGIKSILLLIVVWWLYNTMMIIKYKATLGAKLFGIEVLNQKGDALSFKSASYRFFLSIAPFALYTLLRGMQHDMELAPSPTIQQLPQLLFLLPPFVMFFTQKKEMIHDILAQSIVVDKSELQRSQKEKKMSLLYIGRRVLRVVGTVIFLIGAGYLVVYVGLFYSLAKHNNDSYNASFKQHYSVNDYNNSKIKFYKQELEINTQKFIEAKGVYDIFESDVKNDLAFNCIEYFLAREHNESEWINMGSSFRKNARNRYTNTQEMINKAKKNADYMGKHFYYYDLNEVNHITDTVANIWKKDANRETCQKVLPVDEMYIMFVMPYIKSREEALARDKHEYKSAKSSGMLNKSFYKKNIEETSAWLEILYQKHPDYSKYLQKQNELAQQGELQRKKEKLESAELRQERKKQQIATLQKNIWQDIKNGKYYSMNEVKILNFTIKNSKGQTPLMVAVENAQDNLVDSLRMVDTNFWAKDNRGKTAYDYIQKPKTQRDKMFADRMYGSLRMLEASQIILGRASIISSSYQNKDDNLEIFIQGADCKAFKFAKNTLCKSN